jgi:cobalt-zinc-cadmium resistance protein CzcA
MVGFNVRDRDVQSVVRDVQALCRTQLLLPSGYTLHFGGAFENLQKASARLALVVPLALALIGLLLYLAMGSLRLAALVFVTVPLSAVGGILLLWARGLPFSISAGIGFIVLFGVAVLNGIVLIKEYLSLEDDPALDARGVVLRGTANRLRPVLMTASVASLGFLPMALSQGAGAEVQRPLATVVIGGLLLATLMTLVVLPVLYTLWRHPSLPTPTPPIPNN